VSAGWGRLQARVRSWLRAVAGRRRLEGEMEEEMRFHLEARAKDLMSEGLDARGAMRQARIEFGAVEAHKDGVRRSLGLRWWDELWADLRYGLRVLRKAPGFTAIAVCSLGLAIGANTTIFSVANELLYARLGVPHPEQLRLLTLVGDQHVTIHWIWGEWLSQEGGPIHFNSFSYPVYQRLRAENRSFEDLFAFKDIGRVNVTTNGVAQAVQAELVSGDFYQQMGVRPQLGHSIGELDAAVPSAGAVALISDGFWKRAFGRSPDVIGKVITVNMNLVTIVGVNPAGFTGAKSVQTSPEIFMPLSMIPLLQPTTGPNGDYLSNGKFWWVQMMARSKPGVSDAQAVAALNVSLNAAVRATMTMAKDETVPKLVAGDGSRGLNFAGKKFAKPMYVLLAILAFVLLLTCANTATLLLARAATRDREMKIRLALGASRGRVIRQTLTESLVLSGMSGLLGLMLGYLGRNSFPRLLSNAWEDASIDVPFDWRVFAFAAGITLLTGLLFGVAPAWAATHSAVGARLKEGRHATRQRKTGGRSIVAFQIALSTLLVVGAGLFLHTLLKLNAIDPGFRTEDLVLFELSPPSQRYPAPKDVALHRQMEEMLRGVPGVEAVALTDTPLLANTTNSSWFEVEGTPQTDPKRGDVSQLVDQAKVGRQFLQTMGIQILSGRSFDLRDSATSPRVAVVNETLARKFFPKGDAIGRRFRENDGWVEIIGVFRDIRYSEIKDDPPPVYFDLYEQQHEIGSATYAVRTRMRPEAIVPSLRASVHRVDHDLPLTDVRTQQQQIDASMQQERIFASLTAGFGVLALVLACVGIYGIMAYTVSQRTNEIGIRLALGAERGQVRGMVLRETGLLALLGVAVGLGAALGLGRLVKSLLYGLQPADPASLIAGAGLLIVVAVVAGWVPAARASRVEPMEALRHE
jgi:predicted permease